MATVIYPDGRSEEMKPKDGQNGFTLAELSRAIGGGYIELVHPRFAPQGQPIMIVDEDGHHKQLEYNRIASMLYDPTGNHTIVGTVMLCSNLEVQ